MTFLYNTIALKQKRSRLRKNLTEAESKLWFYLRKKQLGHRFLSQYSIGDYIVDFYCPKLKLAIEVDGGQHNEKLQLEHDLKRTRYLNHFVKYPIP